MPKPVANVMSRIDTSGEHLRSLGLFCALACLFLVPVPLVAEDTTILAAGPLPIAVVEAIPVTLDAVAKQKLVASGSCSSFFQDQPKVDLCPHPGAAADITQALTGLHPNIGVQMLVVAAMPAKLAFRADRNLVLYNLIHQFRSMEGVQYFSATHGKVRTLFTTSHGVKGLRDRVILGDVWYQSIEPIREFLLEQDDTTFGKNLYAVTVKGLEGGGTELTMSNIEQVWFGIMPVLKPGVLKLTMVIQTSADGKYLYFYGNVGITVTKAFGMEGKVRTSFYNRMLALYNWYASQASRT